MTNLEFLSKAEKVYFVAMHEELDAESTSSPVVFTGVGKARATRAFINFIMEHKELINAEKKPLIVSLGTAGSGKHRRGDIVFSDSFVNNGDSFIRERIDFNILPEPTGVVCASSDFFVSEQNFSGGDVEAMRKEFDCLEMESFALANLCKCFGFGFCAVKCISDGADDTVLNFDTELPKFKARLNAFVKSIDR